MINDKMIAWCVNEGYKGEIKREKEKRRQKEEMCYTELTNVTTLIRQNQNEKNQK